MTKPPQHLIDAARRGDWIDPKDPYVRKMMKEAKKEKKEEELRKKKEQEEKIGISLLEYENAQYEEQQYFNENTVNWNYSRKCKWCDSESMRIIIRPDIMHYAEYYCNVCHKYNDWLPYKKRDTGDGV